jgi:hypothetical protein
VDLDSSRASVSLFEVSRVEMRDFKDVISDSFDVDEDLNVEISFSSEARVVSAISQHRALRGQREGIHTRFMQFLAELLDFFVFLVHIGFESLDLRLVAAYSSFKLYLQATLVGLELVILMGCFGEGLQKLIDKLHRWGLCQARERGFRNRKVR